MKKEFASQLDTEKRHAKKELEACNSQWRAELDETNARHEKKEREMERKLVQTKETLKADLEADFNARIEVLEREKAKLKHQIELFELEMKEKQSLQSRVEYLEGELRSSRESNSKSLIQAKEDLEHVRTELKLQHQAELTSALENLRSKLVVEHQELLQQNLDSLRGELGLDYSNRLSASLETCRAEMRSLHDQELIQVQSRHEEEMKRMISSHSMDKQQLIEKLGATEAEAESLRASLWREQEARAREERQRIVDAELAQQRNDEAVARALSIVKRAEERIAHAVNSSNEGNTTWSSASHAHADVPLSGEGGTYTKRSPYEDDMENAEDEDFPRQDEYAAGVQRRVAPPPPPPSAYSSTVMTRLASMSNAGRMRRNSLPATTTSFLHHHNTDESSRTTTTMAKRPSSPSSANHVHSAQASARAMRQSLLQQHQTTSTSIGTKRNNNNLPNYLSQTQSSLAKLENYLSTMPSSPHRSNVTSSRRASSPSVILSRKW